MSTLRQFFYIYICCFITDLESVLLP